MRPVDEQWNHLSPERKIETLSQEVMDLTQCVLQLIIIATKPSSGESVEAVCALQPKINALIVKQVERACEALL
jgi:hypothetical protein